MTIEYQSASQKRIGEQLQKQERNNSIRKEL